MGKTLNFIPFGAHYYRVPTPRPSQWEKDFRNMKNYGFNTIEIWVMWRWSNPKEGKFYFDDIDKIMDLAAKHDLKVILSTKYDSVPAWIFKKYPDSTVTTIYGRKLGPSEYLARQIGGAGGACINHKKVSKVKNAFLEETVKRYRNHEALSVWNNWGEPDAGHSINRIVGNDYKNIEHMVCYCDSCRKEFINWSKNKYKNLKALNYAWHKNYQSWDEIELPIVRDIFSTMLDWKSFHIDRMSEVNVEQENIIRKLDGKHPVMCHTQSMKYFDLMSTSVDMWRFADPGDLHGSSFTGDPFECDIIRSCARGKPVWAIEIHFMPGFTMVFPKNPKPKEIKNYVFMPLAAGFTGFLFWQYRLETVGRESPAWGLTKLDGSSTPWLETASKCCKAILKNQKKILNFKRQPADIAILFSPENQMFTWCAYGNEYFGHDSMVGIHRAMYRANLNVDVIHRDDIRKKLISKYKVLFAPVPMYLNDKTLKAIKEWVRKGGTLIGEAYFGALDTKDGSFRFDIPGLGFDKVFGVKQDWVRAKRDWQNERADIVIDKNLSDVKKGAKLHGMLCEETYKIVDKNVKVLARYKEGEPAITMKNFGRGKAILVGSFIGYDYFKFGDKSTADTILSLAKIGTKQKPIKVKSQKARVDLLKTNKNEAWIIVKNLENKNSDIEFLLPVKGFSKLTNILDGKHIKVNKDKVKINLASDEIEVYELTK